MAHLPFWQEAQRQQAQLSTNSRLIIAEGSQHIIQWDQPAQVITAVNEVVASSR